MHVWLQTLQSYIDGWVTATTLIWPGNEPFQQDDFDAYLRTYRQTTRLRFVQTSRPGQMQPPTITDMYPLQSIAGTRNYAVRTIFFVLYVCPTDRT